MNSGCPCCHNHKATHRQFFCGACEKDYAELRKKEDSCGEPLTEDEKARLAEYIKVEAGFVVIRRKKVASAAQKVASAAMIVLACFFLVSCCAKSVPTATASDDQALAQAIGLRVQAQNKQVNTLLFEEQLAAGGLMCVDAANFARANGLGEERAQAAAKCAYDFYLGEGNLIAAEIIAKKFGVGEAEVLESLRKKDEERMLLGIE